MTNRMVLDSLLASTMLKNELAGSPICCALDPNKFVCTLDNGHNGPHIAYGPDKRVIRTWESIKWEE